MKKKKNIIKLPRKKIVKTKKKRKPRDYSNYKCNLTYVHRKTCIPNDLSYDVNDLKYDIEYNVCEAHQSIGCNGTYEEFKKCKLKEFIKSKEKELKVLRDFFKIKKLKKQMGDMI